MGSIATSLRVVEKKNVEENLLGNNNGLPLYSSITGLFGEPKRKTAQEL